MNWDGEGKSRTSEEWNRNYLLWYIHWNSYFSQKWKHLEIEAENRPLQLGTHMTWAQGTLHMVVCHLEMKELAKETAQNQQKNDVREANHRGMLRTQARVLECSCPPSTGQPTIQHSMLPKAALNSIKCRMPRSANTAASSDYDKTPSLFPLPKQCSQVSSRGHNPEDEARYGGIYVWYHT